MSTDTKAVKFRDVCRLHKFVSISKYLQSIRAPLSLITVIYAILLVTNITVSNLFETDGSPTLKKSLTFINDIVEYINITESSTSTFVSLFLSTLSYI